MPMKMTKKGTMINSDSSSKALGKSEHHKNNVDKIKKKISKGQQHQEPINNLIKVLRPKVYITDSSTFKSLVQQLTGNGVIATNVVDVDIPVEATREALVPDVSIEETSLQSFDDYHSSPSDQYPVFLDGASPSLSEDRSSYNSLEESDHHNPMMLSDSSVSESSNFLLEDLDMARDPFSYRDLESWLLDLDQPEVSIYDYPLTGLF